MALAIDRENYFWHKVHSLTGIIPIGFYMVQHLTLNSFSLAGASKFDAVIGFFDGMPIHILLLLEIFLIWIPIVFHAVYGTFIVFRGRPNYFNTKYKWSQNRMYLLQRVTGVFLLFFLIFHVASTTGEKYLQGNSQAIYYAAWHDKLTGTSGLFWLPFYILGVLAASYHLGYGIWNFCIRWGITVSERSQIRVQKFAAVFFVAITLLGWLALAGFLMNRPGDTAAFNGSQSVPALPAATQN